MPFWVNACVNIVFVAFIYVGLVGRPAVVAEARLRRNVLCPVVPIAVAPCVLERMAFGAVEVDPNRTALTPCHQIGPAFANLG